MLGARERADDPLVVGQEEDAADIEEHCERRGHRSTVAIGVSLESQTSRPLACNDSTTASYPALVNIRRRSTTCWTSTSLCFGRTRTTCSSPTAYHVLAVVTLLDGSRHFQQRQHRVPFDVVARRVLEDLEERVPMVVVQVLGSRGRHRTPLRVGHPSVQSQLPVGRHPSRRSRNRLVGRMVVRRRQRRAVVVRVGRVVPVPVLARLEALHQRMAAAAVRGGWRAATATSRSSRRGRRPRSAGGGTTIRPRPSTRRSPCRSAAPSGRWHLRTPCAFLSPGRRSTLLERRRRSVVDGEHPA